MSGEFYVEPVSDEKLGVTTVTIAGYVGSHVVTGTGASRLAAPDKFDADIGESLATVRALRQAADKLEKSTRREIDRREQRRAKQAAKDEERRAIRQAHNELAWGIARIVFASLVGWLIAAGGIGLGGLIASNSK